MTACIRPEHMRIEAEGAPTAEPSLTATVEIGLPLGSSIVHEVRTRAGQPIKISEPRAPGAVPRLPGTAVRIRPVAPEVVSVFATSH